VFLLTAWLAAPPSLRDAATGRSAALVQVKQLQNQGRFLFVGYKLD